MKGAAHRRNPIPTLALALKGKEDGCNYFNELMGNFQVKLSGMDVVNGSGIAYACVAAPLLAAA